MASIVDSFREVFTERLSFLKLVILAIPVYYSYQVFLQSKDDYTLFLIIVGITLFFLFGVLVKITNNVVNERGFILPSLNPLKIVFSAFKCLIAISLLSIITCLIANYVCSLINIVPWLDITLKSIIWLIAASIITTSFLMFSTKERILDAYNLKIIFQKSGDIILTIIFFIIQLIIINLPTSAFVGYTLFILFGYGSFIFVFFLALVLVFNIAVVGHYMAQVHYEILTYERLLK